jgi:hypothetical protein
VLMPPGFIFVCDQLKAFKPDIVHVACPVRSASRALLCRLTGWRIFCVHHSCSCGWQLHRCLLTSCFRWFRASGHARVRGAVVRCRAVRTAGAHATLLQDRMGLPLPWRSFVWLTRLLPAQVISYHTHIPEYIKSYTWQARHLTHCSRARHWPIVLTPPASVR